MGLKRRFVELDKLNNKSTEYFPPNAAPRLDVQTEVLNPRQQSQKANFKMSTSAPAQIIERQETSHITRSQYLTFQHGRQSGATDRTDSHAASSSRTKAVANSDGIVFSIKGKAKASLLNNTNSTNALFSEASHPFDAQRGNKKNKHSGESLAEPGSKIQSSLPTKGSRNAGTSATGTTSNVTKHQQFSQQRQQVGSGLSPVSTTGGQPASLTGSVDYRQAAGGKPSAGILESSSAAPRDWTKSLYYRLGHRVLKMAQKNEMTETQREKLNGILDTVQEIVSSTFRTSGVAVEPFGSFMCDLGSSTSDIDLVITGLRKPPAHGDGFYGWNDRASVASLLHDLEAPLRRAFPSLLPGTRGILVIGHARMPVLKMTFDDDTKADLSISGHEGPIAAEFVLQQVRKYWPLRPLVVFLKSFLKRFNLNEVKDGGLSSYGLTYMVLAHLMAEERSQGAASPRGQAPFSLPTFSAVVAAGGLAANSPLSPKAFRAYETGRLLHSFFDRFGNNFSLYDHAISVLDGGVVPKSYVQKYVTMQQYNRITTIDPNTEREVTHGSYQAEEILNTFRTAARYTSAHLAEEEDDEHTTGPSASVTPATPSTPSSASKKKLDSSLAHEKDMAVLKSRGFFINFNVRNMSLSLCSLLDLLGPHDSDAESDAEEEEGSRTSLSGSVSASVSVSGEEGGEGEEEPGKGLDSVAGGSSGSQPDAAAEAAEVAEAADAAAAAPIVGGGKPGSRARDPVDRSGEWESPSMGLGTWKSSSLIAKRAKLLEGQARFF